MPAYQPNDAPIFPGDDTPDLDAILREVKQGCAAHEKVLVRAGTPGLVRRRIGEVHRLQAGRGRALVADEAEASASSRDRRSTS